MERYEGRDPDHGRASSVWKNRSHNEPLSRLWAEYLPHEHYDGSTAGDKRWDDRKIYEENLIQTFFAMEYLKKTVAVPFVMSADGISRTENVPQVLAIREALVNLRPSRLLR